MNANAQSISFLPPASVHYVGGSRITEIHRLAIADFNQDGRLDVAFQVEAFIPLTGVLFGNADGSFRMDLEAVPGVQSGDAYAADFDGDGNTDLLFGNGSTGTRLARGDGKGRFSAATIIEGCAQVSAVADLNRDLRQDILCGDTVLLGERVLLGEAAGGFRTVSAKLQGTAVEVADFNGDGKTDVVLRGADGRQGVALGAGDGTFGTLAPLAASENFTSELAADLNGDGRTDLVMLSADRSVISVWLGRGDGTFAPPQTGPGVPGGLNAVADFNRDGKLDLIAEDALLAGNGDGTFRTPVWVGVVTTSCPGPPGMLSCEYTHLANAVADFNGDGLPDLAAGYTTTGLSTFRGSSVAILLNNSPGDGFLAAGVSAATGNAPVGPHSLVTAFGANLATRTEAAATNPAPTTLGGIRLHVRDREHPEGRLAPLLYVSPTQINYVLDSDEPYAWVDIERLGSPYVPKAMAVPIARLAPGLFTLGSDVAAATAVRVAPDGAQTPVTVAVCAGSNCRAEPIDLSSGPVYLSLFGTGFSHAGRGICTIGTTVAPVAYAGPQGQFAGLDQINVLVPTALRGRGEVMISCELGLPGAQGNGPPVRTNAVRVGFR